MSDEIRALEERVVKLKEQLRQQKREEALAVLETYISDAEKLAAFDRLKVQALDYAVSVIDHGYRDDDADHYLFESTMQETLGKNIFSILNRFG